MVKSALPEHINESHEWAGTDHDTWLMRWYIPFKIKFCVYGPRAKESWARWRRIPKTLANLNASRIETLQDCLTKELLECPSVIQYWERWHFLVQWPLHFSFHYYWPWTKVPKSTVRPGDFTIKDMVYIRFGARFDQDQVYWFPSAFVGGDFN